MTINFFSPAFYLFVSSTTSSRFSHFSPTKSPHFHHPFIMYAPEPPPPRARQPQGTAASIWAPQPQPSESTWPQTLDSFSRVAEREFGGHGRGDQSRYPVVRREDVFGPVPPLRDVGAIGDGRKKNSPEFDDGVSPCYHFLHHRGMFECLKDI